MPFISTTTTSEDRPIDTTRKSGVSKIVKQSIPKFILDEYPLFVEFLEAYYEWLDQHGNPVEFLQNGSKYFDVDTTTEEFLQYFKSSFLDGFPKNVSEVDGKKIDHRTLVKNIRELYKIKGTEKSIRLFFRLIAGSEIIIEYPRDMMFVLSSANYKNYHKICVLKDELPFSNGFDANDVEGIVLNQYEGLTELIASANIIDTYEIASGGKEYLVFSVTNPSGEFIQSDFSPISFTQGLTLHQFYPVPMVTDLRILKGGKDYSAGEFLTVGETLGENIKGFVSQTDYEGSITNIRLFDTPVDYNGTDNVTVFSPLGTGAQFSIRSTILSDPISEYKDNKNLLSRSSKLQDSYEYQQFSYVVKSKRSLEEYIDAIKTIIHPSGFVLFNSLYNNIYSLRPSNYGTRVMAYENTSIGSYAGYSPNISSGAGNTAGWNFALGRPDGDNYPWGKVFSRWTDQAANPIINPSEGIDSIPDNIGGRWDRFLGGTFASVVGGRAILPNLTESQYEGLTHWLAMPHPSGRSGGLPAGIEFKNIKLNDILKMPVPNIVE